MSKMQPALARAASYAHTAAVSGVRQSGSARVTEVDEYERLASKILHARAASPFGTVMIVSPDHGEGSSTIAARLAESLSTRGQLSVVLLDANFRSPAPTEHHDIDAAVGLADVLSGAVVLETAVLDGGTPKLRLLAAGRVDDDAPRLLDSPRLTSVLEVLAAASDIVVIDGPPVLPYADALTLAARVDRVIVVTQADRTPRDRLERAAQELTAAGATILGAVLNRKASHAPPWLTRCLNL
jgi:non-specific protein-tyrosine kinase